MAARAQLAFCAAVLALACARPQAPTATSVSHRAISHRAYAHYMRAQVAMFEEDYARAVGELRAAVASAPEEPHMVATLAEALAAAGDVTAALGVSRGGQRRWPKQAGIWLVSGHVAHMAGRNNDAAAAFTRAIQLAPNDERGYLGLIYVTAKQGRREEAESGWLRLTTNVPASVEGHVGRGKALAARGQHRPAAIHLQRALELDPDHIEARMALATSLRAAGDLDGAIVQAHSAFDRSGHDLELAGELFRLLCKRGDWQTALDVLSAIAE